MTDREVMQQAIALICSARLCEINSMSSRQEMLRLMIEATDILRARLAEPEPEPVAWRYKLPSGKLWHFTPHGPHEFSKRGLGMQPLYTTPPTRRPLTESE